jgi:bifunctional DNA-binding transcriptional regulator/antitoxin component of YhaV-PrlF toxin-antitoxin module
MRSRLINRRQQGDLGEASAIEWLTRQGATVLIPFGHSPDYDLVAEIDGHLMRIQVKTSTYAEVTPNGHGRYQVQLATNGGNQSWTGIAKRFDSSRADYVFILVGDGRRWLIPVHAIEAHNALTLGGPKYAEFEIDSGHPIAELVYGEQGPTLESRDRPGEYPSGQRTAPVKRQAYAFAGSNPASPTPHPGAGATPSETTSGNKPPLKFQRTTISSTHRVTIPSVTFRAAALDVGDRLHATADGPGRVILERIEPASEPLRLLSDGGEVEPL